MLFKWFWITAVLSLFNMTTLYVMYEVNLYSTNIMAMTNTLQIYIYIYIYILIQIYICIVTQTHTHIYKLR